MIRHECAKCGTVTACESETLAIVEIVDQQQQGWDHGTSVGVNTTTTYRLSEKRVVHICQACIKSHKNHALGDALWFVPISLALISIALAVYFFVDFDGLNGLLSTLLFLLGVGAAFAAVIVTIYGPLLVTAAMHKPAYSLASDITTAGAPKEWVLNCIEK